jgi:Bacteriophage tail sheath protein
MATYKTPGVYIEELPANGPIAGVGTSTPAFLGVALKGPTFQPVKVTNWTQFRDSFGDYMVGPPRFYMAYAVKGFFDNGGTVAYIVRVGTAVRAFRDLDDRGPAPPGKALRVTAKQEGPAGNAITVAVADAQIVPLANNAVVHKDRAQINNAAANVITLANPADASKFRGGDTVTIETTAERAVIDRVRNADLVLLTNLLAPHGAGMFVRIADLVVNQTQFRVDNINGLEPGSVIRLQQGATNDPALVISAVAGDFITLAGVGLANPYALDQASAAVTIESFEFALTITSPPNAPENFPNLSMDPRHSRYWGAVVSSSYVDVGLPPVPSVQPPPANRPAVLAASNLAGGTADNPAIVGLPHYNSGLNSLVPIEDVQLVCVPDRADQAVQQAVITHCETLGDRFAILHTGKGLKPDASMGSPLALQRAWCESARGYASLYYPWIMISDPSSLTGNDTLLVPPSGHMAGIYARSDEQRGVHKAPANELIAAAIGLETIVDSVTQGELNVAGIDVLRVFPGQVRPIVWGARTTSPVAQTAWIHNSVRRLFIFVETSLRFGLRPWVFEPNNLTLWKKLDRTITEFLTRVWQSGALFGAKASEAFYVKIDEELNPPSVRALGQVIIEIGMAPVHPAEFVIVRIGIWEGGASITEA